MIDIFDPNNWLTPEPYEWRIYLDNTASTYAVVDEIDYYWAVKWRWNAKPSKSKHIIYAFRSLTQRNKGERLDSSLYLHVEIMKRTGIKPPTPFHTMVDHRHGKSLDCRRPRLRWATPAMNRRNINGAASFDLVEDQHALRV